MDPKPNRLAAQRGWFYDEFGQQLVAMSHNQGSLADFRSLLRRLDDCKDTYVYATTTHGHEVLRYPYLALLANLWQGKGISRRQRIRNE